MLIYLQVIDAPEDRDQFITLYETYRGLMFYVANQILQNEQDAEDAVHDAFLSVAEHIKKFSRLERHKTKAFLVTIVIFSPVVVKPHGMDYKLKGGIFYEKKTFIRNIVVSFCFLYGDISIRLCRWN